MISGWGRAAGAVIPALGSGRYSPGPNIGLPSWRKGSDPNCTINVFWGQPGALATVSKNLLIAPGGPSGAAPGRSLKLTVTRGQGVPLCPLSKHPRRAPRIDFKPLTFEHDPPSY